jgi:hypothetical protein
MRISARNRSSSSGVRSFNRSISERVASLMFLGSLAAVVHLVLERVADPYAHRPRIPWHLPPLPQLERQIASVFSR